MNLPQLHEQYGRLLIQAEILQARIKQTKTAIAEAMNARVSLTEAGSAAIDQADAQAPADQDADQ
ncbi:MAG: hypothetical protein ACLFUJ_02970 [Phycisphaerae bacterium]